MKLPQSIQPVLPCHPSPQSRLVESNLKFWDLILLQLMHEDESYAEAENDTDCNSDTDGDLNSGVPQDFLVHDFRNTLDPDDIFALSGDSLYTRRSSDTSKDKTLE